MKCPNCGNATFATKETKNYKNEDYCRRRRVCLECGTAFTTYEVPMTPKEYRTRNGEQND